MQLIPVGNIIEMILAEVLSKVADISTTVLCSLLQGNTFIQNVGKF